MDPDFTPARDDFDRIYDNGEPQLVFARLVNDLDTPVSAYLKIAKGRPYAFLFESVQGGEQRGRFSFIGFSPDLIWRSFGDKSECARGLDAVSKADYVPLEGKPLDTLREIQAESAFTLPDDIPPMAAGLFGYLGYEMVRHVETLETENPDPLKTPDAVMTRPTIVAIFDQIAQEIIVASPVYPSDLSAEKAYAAATARIDAVRRDLTLPAQGGALAGGEQRGLLPGVQQMHSGVAFSVGAGVMRVHVDAKGAVVDLRGAQFHQLNQAVFQPAADNCFLHREHGFHQVGGGGELVDTGCHGCLLF